MLKISDVPEIQNGPPKRLGKSAILEAVLEVRFRSMIEEDALLGAVRADLKADFPKVDRLPVADIPVAIRSSDPSFEFAPLYKLPQSPFTLQIGPRSVSLACSKPYCGSEKFFSCFEKILDIFATKQVFNSFERIGVRYIDFFDVPLFPTLQMDLRILDKSLDEGVTQLKTAIKVDENCELVINIAGGAIIPASSEKGSVLDIDVQRKIMGNCEIHSIKQFLKDAHAIQKKVFFGFLTQEGLANLEPKWD